MVSLLPPTIWATHHLEWGQRTYLMGVVNVTPDSFSNDGLARDTLSEDVLIERAVTLAQRFVEEGATFIDVGGESTRPGASPLSAQQELARVLPVIRALRANLPASAIISIDTYKAEVAEQALAAGAEIVNDIWALRYDPRMADVVRECHVPVVLMANMRPWPANAPAAPRYEVVSDIVRLLARSIDHALAAGIAWEQIIIDPGLGFGLTAAENLTILQRLGELRVLGRPLLLGASRKSTIGRVLDGAPTSQRLEGGAATVALGIAQGTDIVRVHDVHAMALVARMSDAIVRGTFTLTPLR